MTTTTVLKYPMGDRHCYIKMPKGAEILHVGEQENNVWIWVLAEVLNMDDMREREFGCIGTGQHTFLTKKEYVGTVQMQNSDVWHIFDGGWVKRSKS